MTQQHNPNCAIVRLGNSRAWCDCERKLDTVTDKITFKIGGEEHVLPIDSSKTLRVGSVSPSMKLTAETVGLSIPPQKIVFNQNSQPIMTIHPDGRITLGESAQPTEAAAACIEAMSHMIQNMIRLAVEADRKERGQ